MMLMTLEMQHHSLWKASFEKVKKIWEVMSIVPFSQICAPQHCCYSDKTQSFWIQCSCWKVMMTIWPTGSFRCSLEHKTGSFVCGEEENSKLSVVMTNMWIVSLACVDIISVSGFRGGRGLRAGGAIFPLPSFWKHCSSSPLSGETIKLSFLSVLCKFSNWLGSCFSEN